ncbi:MAG: molybdopterin-dependent oxidoreductase [Aestuariivita sp.]|nr:molybdopterin-dependent oxidoreductase [Aestuariivita sp.]
MNDVCTGSLNFKLNGDPVSVASHPGARLSDVLREILGARDVKVGCNAGDCGSCTVLVNNTPVCSCLTAAYQVQDHHVETVAGLVHHDRTAQDLIERFQDHGAAQCGICTPGMIISATALLRQIATPCEDQVKDALGGVLCRCTGYRKIIAAVRGLPSNVQGNGAIGDSVRRLDGAAKVRGEELFGDDIAPFGVLEIRVIRSPFHHASFEFGDLERFQSSLGLDAILTAHDVPRNRFGVIPGFYDQPVFAEAVARFKGEAVAAVVGNPEVVREFSDRDFPVSWTEKPPLLTSHQALQDSAAALHHDKPSNEMCSGRVKCGDANAALDQAEVIVKGRFKTAFVEHAYIEPEAGMARIREGRLEVFACTQSAVMDQEALAFLLDIECDQIRIVPTGIGGGFGSKLDLSVQPFLALAARKTGQTVRMAYNRVESMQSSTKRHAADISMQIGATANGDISGIIFDGTFNTGAYASWGPTVANRVPIHASGPYRITDYKAEARGIYTHCAPAGAFRGFGVPQAGIAQESLFEELAIQLGKDSLEFRIDNALENNTPTVCGQIFRKGVGIKQCLQELRPYWKQALAETEQFNSCHTAQKRGVGVASGWYGCGNTSLQNPSTIKAGVRSNGQLVLHQGAIDIGQGSNTVVSQLFASALGTSLSAVTLVNADTDRTPDAGKTSASRQTFISGNAAQLCGQSLRNQILRHVNASTTAMIEFSASLITVIDTSGRHEINLVQMEISEDGYVFAAQETYDPPTSPLDHNGQGEPYAQYGYAAHIAIVNVDLALGTVQPIRVIAAHDVGRAINPMLVEGQVEGGVAQGLGMALMEEFLPGETDNLHDYLIPTIGDVPPIETVIVEVEDAHGPGGAKGLGEHALIPTAPAILNAIRHATGVQMHEVPVTPTRLLAALRDHNS